VCPLRVYGSGGGGGHIGCGGSRKASEASEFDEDGEPKVVQEVSGCQRHTAIVGDRFGDSRR
jgi:hypothetical protein